MRIGLHTVRFHSNINETFSCQPQTIRKTVRAVKKVKVKRPPRLIQMMKFNVETEEVGPMM